MHERGAMLVMAEGNLDLPTTSSAPRVAGYANKDIATKLVISTRTVETHRQRIMNKLAARSLTDLFQLASRHGLIG